MKCTKCQVGFNPNDKAEIGTGNDDAVEVKTECPNCGFRLYTFVEVEDWVSEDDGEAVAKALAGGKS